MKKILVTGGSGFLGKSVVRFLSMYSDSYEILTPSHDQCDLMELPQVRGFMRLYRPDYVVHLAASCGGIGINREQPGKFIYNNLQIGMNLIEESRKHGVEKIVNVGTVCSYPKYTQVPFRESEIWNGYPEETNAPYGIAKKTLMEMLKAYNNQYGLKSTNLIPVNMYGPHDNFNPGSSHVIPALILKLDQALEQGERSVEIWGTGRASREFLHVEDCARAICYALNVDTSPDPINIGTGSEIKICDLVDMLAYIMGYSGVFNFNSQFPDGQPRRCLDVSNAKKLLGFSSTKDLASGLHETVKWYYSNKKRIVSEWSN